MRTWIGAGLLAACWAGGMWAQNDATAAARKLLDLHNAWNPSKNYRGATLKVQEVAKQGNAVTYEFVATGLPRNRRYLLVSLPITTNAPKVIQRGVTLDAAGKAVCSGKVGECTVAGKPNAPVRLKVGTMAGEPMRLGLAAEDDQSVAAFVNETRRPLAATDRGCKIDVVLLDAKATMLHVTATGFPPRTGFTLTSTSAGKVTTMNLTADANGHYAAGLIPTRPSAATGTIQVKAAGKSCAPSVAVPWSVTR